MEKFVYYINAITDLHVGAGDLNYNVVDKEVEKDPLTNQPIIHASGIKGAIKAHVQQKNINEDHINAAFGKQADSKNMSETSGAYRFINAYLLSRPLRACGKDTYVNVTSIRLLKDYVEMLTGFGFTPVVNFDDIKTLEEELKDKKFISSVDMNIEGETVTQISDNAKTILKPILGEEFAIAHNLDEYDLPVIARNNLKDTNLWYEEFVPRHSKFYSVVLKMDECELEIEKYLEKDFIQIGGNSSVGYGYCKFEVVKSEGKIDE